MPAMAEASMQGGRAASARSPWRRRVLGALLVCATVATAWGQPASGAARQRQFASIDDAVGALVAAIRDGDLKAMTAILGDQGKGLVSSGDAVADRRARERFVAAYDQKHRLEAGGGKVVLVVGDDDFPFPIPLVPSADTWHFDTAAGREEIVNRRIGENELNTIQVCLAYVDAQREYYARDPDRNGLLQYAQRFASGPGKRDGLYWQEKPGEAPSPLGPLVAKARSEGYTRRSAPEVPVAYWGYHYRILSSQGKDAPGGAYDYLAQGRMIGGFAMVAYPAQYGASGVMTFLVNHDGVVYEKNLGPNTSGAARAMRQFNPDSTWKKVATR